MTSDDFELLGKAFWLAATAHDGQRRKYTGEPYLVHPAEVAALVYENGGDAEMMAAALLHDVVEDTDVTIDGIAELCGPNVAGLVLALTDVSRSEDGNRAARKAKDRQHLQKQCGDAKTIKLADLISNHRSISSHDPGFAEVYQREAVALLDVLKEGGPKLWNQLKTLLEQKPT